MEAPLLPAALFAQACAILPLVSIDWVLTNASCQLLLGKRNNAPARDYWFTPGGRIRKGEPLSSAKFRIAKEELGLSVEVLDRAILMGAWDHFYSNSAFDSSVSTHYVNLPHWVQISEVDKLDLVLPSGATEQHSAWQWFDLTDASGSDVVHPYVRVYAQWVADRII